MEKQTKNSNSNEPSKKPEEKAAPLSRTLSEMFRRNGEQTEDSDQKILRRYDSLRVVQRSVSSISDFGSKMATQMKKSKGAVSSSKSRSVMAPAKSRSNFYSTRGRRGKEMQRQPSTIAAPMELHPGKRMFGVALEELMERQSKIAHSAEFHIPIFLNKLIEHLQFRAVRTEGILRVAGGREDTNIIKAKLNAGESVDLYKVNVHVLVDLLKSFIRELPGDLLDSEKVDKWVALSEVEDQSRRAVQIKSLILELDRYRKAVLTVLFTLFHEVVRNSDYTKMDNSNLARCFAPNLLDGSVGQLSPIKQMDTTVKVTEVVETMLSKYEFIFRELQAQYRTVKTINFANAATKREGTARVKSSLRSVPPTPPSQRVESKTAKVSKEEAKSVTLVLADQLGTKKEETATPEFKRMKSEQEVLRQRFRLETPPLTRASTASLLQDKESIMQKKKKVSKRARQEDENLSPNSPLKKLAAVKGSPLMMPPPPPRSLVNL